jgi:hypothetical protein
MESERARRAEHRAKLEIAVGYLNADMKAHGVRWFLDPGKLEAALITAGILPDDRPPTRPGAGAGASAQGAQEPSAIPGAAIPATRRAALRSALVSFIENELNNQAGFEDEGDHSYHVRATSEGDTVYAHFTDQDDERVHTIILEIS